LTWIRLIGGGLALFAALMLLSFAVCLHTMEKWAEHRGLELVDSSFIFGSGPFHDSEVRTVGGGDSIKLVFRVAVRMKADPNARMFRGHLCMPSMNLSKRAIIEHWDGDRPGPSLLAVEERERNRLR